LMKPLTECACQPVCSMISARLAPPCGAAGPGPGPFCCPRRAPVSFLAVLAALAAAAWPSSRPSCFGRALRVVGILGPGGGLWRNVGRLWRGGGIQFLDGFPDPGHGALAVRELLDRLQVGADSGDSGKAVPDLDQPVGRPVGGKLGQLLLMANCSWPSRNLLGGGEGGEGVLSVDGESRIMSSSIVLLQGGASGPPTGCEPRVRLPDWFHTSRRRATRG